MGAVVSYGVLVVQVCARGGGVLCTPDRRTAEAYNYITFSVLGDYRSTPGGGGEGGETASGWRIRRLGTSTILPR